MRISLVIAALAAIAVGMVHLRRAQTRAHHQVHRLQMEQISLRTKLYDQQRTLGFLAAPRQVEQRARRMDAGLTYRFSARGTVADRRR